MLFYHYIEALRNNCLNKKKKSEKLKYLFNERAKIQKIVLTEIVTGSVPIYSKDRSRFENVTSIRKIFSNELEDYKSLVVEIDKLIEEIKLTVPEDFPEPNKIQFENIDLSSDPTFRKKKGNLTGIILNIVDGWLDLGNNFTYSDNEIFNMVRNIMKKLDENKIEYDKESFPSTAKRILNYKRMFEKILNEFVPNNENDFQSFNERIKGNRIPFAKSYIKKRFNYSVKGIRN